MEKLTKIEKIILWGGVGIGLGAAFLGAKLDLTWLMGSGASLAGAAVIGVGTYEAYKTLKNEDKVIKPKNNYQYEQAITHSQIPESNRSCGRLREALKDEKAGKSNYCWNPRDWR